MKQHIRDLVTGELTLDYFVRRAAEGWKVASIEWVREEATDQPVASEPAAVLTATGQPPLPYGLQFASSGSRLEENPLEATVLLLILDQIVKEKRITDIANQLNVSGYRTREGTAWSAAAVFNLLPRLIEVGPAVLKSSAWEQRRTAGSTTH